MEVSIFLAKAWGLYMVIIAGVLLARKETLQSLISSVQDKNIVLTYGFMALIVGLLTILTHNIWTLDFRGLITLFGWAAFLKGVTLISHPEFAIKALKVLKIQRKGGFIYIQLGIILILGLYLAVVGFAA